MDNQSMILAKLDELERRLAAIEQVLAIKENQGDSIAERVRSELTRMFEPLYGPAKHQQSADFPLRTESLL